VSDRPRRDDRDPHRRFGEWLLAAGDEDPPRDVAVHASVCPDCQRQIAALDMLTAVDLARAGPPPARAAIIERRLAPRTRVAVAVGGAAAVAALAFGSWRLADGTGIGIGPAGETPNQEVLGNTGQPEPTLGPSPTRSDDASAETSPSTRPSNEPSGVPSSTQLPLLTQAPFNQPPAATPRPTSQPTRTPRPSLAPTPTPAPTSAPSPSAQPTPTPEITPTPTESPTPAAAA
jgi:hypothetical protein